MAKGIRPATLEKLPLTLGTRCAIQTAARHEGEKNLISWHTLLAGLSTYTQADLLYRLLPEKARRELCRQLVGTLPSKGRTQRKILSAIWWAQPPISRLATFLEENTR